MSDLLGRGYSGGHITLIFTVEDEANELTEQGSLGAGICLEDGVEVITRDVKEKVGSRCPSLATMEILRCTFMRYRLSGKFSQRF